MRSLIFVALSFIVTACSSVRPNASITNLCPSSVAVIRDAEGNQRARISTGGQASVQMDEYPAQQLLTADLISISGGQIIGHFSRTFSKEIYDNRYNYNTTAPTGAYGTNGYDWSFGPTADRQSCGENLGGSGNAAWSIGGSQSSGPVRRQGPPAWL